jgi:recombination protein RecT
MAQTQTAARPQLVDARREGPPPPNGQPPTLRAIFENPKVTAKLAAAVPGHLNPQRMLRVLSLCVLRTPKLAEALPMTLLGAMMVCASLGLEPNMPLQHAFLIPYNRRRRNKPTTVEINLIIGYRGFIDLARRTGTLVSLHADVVYGAAELGKQGDLFEFEYGSNMHLKHVPLGDRSGTKLWAYAHANLKDGQAFEVLPYARVLEIRDNHSEAYRYALEDREEDPRGFARTPWVMHEHQMSSKTMIRQLSRYLPMSIEFANAVTLDAMSESGRLDLAALADGGFDIDAEELAGGAALDDADKGTGEDDGADRGAGEERQQRQTAGEAGQQASGGGSADHSREPAGSVIPSQGSSDGASSAAPRRRGGAVNFDA